MSFDRMFIPALIDDAGLSMAAFRVLAHLSRRAGKDAPGFPAVKSIAKVCRANKKTVWRALNELEKAGLVQRQQRSGTSSLYLIKALVAAKNLITQREGCPSDTPNPKEGLSPDPERGSPGDPKEALTGDPKRGAQRVSTEGYPLKEIHGRGEPPPVSIFKWSDLSEDERQKIVVMAGAKAESEFNIWRGTKLKYGDIILSTHDAVCEVQAQIDARATRAAAPKPKPVMTKVMIGTSADPVMVDLDEMYNDDKRYRVYGTRNGLPDVVDFM